MKRLVFLLFLMVSCLGSGQEIDLSIPELKADMAQIQREVDSLISAGIREQAFPGAQLLVARNGNVIFHEAFGHHTYDSLRPVRLTDLYDLASVTKVTGPLPALMKLVEEGKLDLDTPFSEYWEPWKRRKGKKSLTLREILAHQAGLVPYIVFLNEVLKKGSLKKRFVRKFPEKRFPIRAYDSLYVHRRFHRKMYRMINRSRVSEEKTYQYSGLTFLLFPELISRLTGVDYEYYLLTQFYQPMGCHTLVFNPTEKGLGDRVVPTEIDTLYRHDLTQGWVHDENASLFGGVSGNAGLFGTAEDLWRIMQMYQNYGSLEGKRYLSEAVVREFTRVQYADHDNRRGLGFDKPLLNNAELPLDEAYPAPGASPESFGHSGFTGTFVWADPVNQLVFIFLSNRVYPDRDHRKLYSSNLRSRLQEVFYSSLISKQ